MSQAIEVVVHAAHTADSASGRTPPPAFFTARNELRGAIAAGALLLLGSVVHVWMKVPGTGGIVWASLAIGMIFGGRAAWLAIRDGKFDIDVLMVVGAGLAAYIGHPGEGALLLFLFVLSGALEDLAMQRTKREVEALHKLMPSDALVLRGGEWVEADAKTLAAGERVKIRPGERVPADAALLTGETSMDQSAITGESMPRHVRPGDELYAGTINTDDPVEARVLRPVAESSLQKILDLVTRAREQREPVQRTIDRLSQPYSLAVFGVSIAAMLVWRFALQREWVYSLNTAITLLIVASPCALVIATPTATLAGIARGARGGVLFKGGQAIERLANLGAVCFDKTGTLTIGRPRLYEVHPVAWSDGRALMALAAGLEADSTHPIATAVREAAAQRAIDAVHFAKTDHIAGRGIVGALDGRPVRLGSYTHAEPLIPICFRNRVKEILARIQERGHIGVVVAAGGTLDGSAYLNSPDGAGGEAAVLIMADAVRPGAKQMVGELHELGIRPVRMLTGDNAQTARRVADSLGLDAVDAELLPKDKLDAVEAMKRDLAARSHGRRGVGVIGDGVNDAPALAAADVSLGIGAIGTAAALESADIVILSDDLTAVSWSVRLARRTRTTVRRNLGFALSIIGCMALATLVGSWLSHPVPLSLGVFAHEGGTLLVVLNSLLLLRYPGLGGGAGRAMVPHARPTAHAAPA